MTLPNLPTDNLYKFTFLGGLTIIIASCILYVIQVTSVTEKVDKIGIETATTSAELEFLNYDIKSISIELDSIEKSLNGIVDTIDQVKRFKELRKELYEDKNYREFYAFLLQHKSDLIPYSKDMERLKILTEKNKEKSREITLKKKIYALKIKTLKRELNIITILTIFVAITIAVGLKMANTGYVKWYNLVQNPIDEKLKIELRMLKESSTRTIENNES